MLNEELKTRLLSLLWRTGAFLVVAGIGFIVSQLGQFDLPVIAITAIGLVAGEVTKWLNNKYQLGRAVLAGIGVRPREKE